MSIYKKTEQIGIRCTFDLRKRLEEMAAQDKRNLSDYIHLVLEKHAGSK